MIFSENKGTTDFFFFFFAFPFLFLIIDINLLDMTTISDKNWINSSGHIAKIHIHILLLSTNIFVSQYKYLTQVSSWIFLLI